MPTLPVAQQRTFVTDAFFFFHHVNAYEDPEDPRKLHVDLCAYDDPQVSRGARPVLLCWERIAGFTPRQGPAAHDRTHATLLHLRLRAQEQAGVRREPLPVTHASPLCSSWLLLLPLQVLHDLSIASMSGYPGKNIAP